VQRQPAAELPLRPLERPDVALPKKEKPTADPGKGIQPKAVSNAPLFQTKPVSVTLNDVTQSKPVEQMAVLPQARGQVNVIARRAVKKETAGTPPPSLPPPGRAVAAEPEGDRPHLPLALLSRQTTTGEQRREAGRDSARSSSGVAEPAAVVQRYPDSGRPTPATETDSGTVHGVVQRSGLSVDEGGVEQQSLDLDNLAREIYPLVKRMLAVERERRPFR
jgi:hypothetical protein